MPTSGEVFRPGDIVEVEFGQPTGREAGFIHPAVIVTADRTLEAHPTVVQVVPLTSTIRGFISEPTIEPDAFNNGLGHRSAAQCQHVRGISVRRIQGRRGNVGPAALAAIRDTMMTLIGMDP